MDDTQNKKQEEIVEEVNEANQDASNLPVEKASSLEEKPQEIEAPEKIDAIEAPKEKLIEAKEEDGEVAPAEEIILQNAEPETPAVSNTSASDDISSSDKAAAVSNASPSDQGRWYIVHTYSGHENKVAKSLHQRIESMGFENRIFDIIVPTRETVKVSQGKKETVKEKIFPGYVLVKMILDDESWLLVRTTQGVTAFIGAGNKPTPISDKEVEAIQKFMATEEPLYKTSFTIGEAVKIVDGPFADFLGTIDNIDEAKGKLKVLVSIFGRETPVELDFLQVSKL